LSFLNKKTVYFSDEELGSSSPSLLITTANYK
jgi:hypothetical protein